MKKFVLLFTVLVFSIKIQAQFTLNSAREGRVTESPIAPANPQGGDRWHKTSTDSVFVWNNQTSNWDFDAIKQARFYELPNIPDDAPLGSRWVSDLSGAIYKIQSTAPVAADGVCVAAKGANFAVIQPNQAGFYDVTHFGAIENDTLPDTIAIQKTIDFGIAAGRPKVFFPPGDYSVYSQQNSNGIFAIDNGTMVKGVEFAGVSEKSRIVYRSGMSQEGTIFYLRRIDGLVIRDLVFTSSVTPDTSWTNGGWENDPLHVMRTAVLINNAGDDNTDNVRITGCTFENGNGIMVHFNDNGASDYLVDRCVFRNIMRDTEDGAIGDPTGILVAGTGGKNKMITNCFFYDIIDTQTGTNNQAHGLYIGGESNIQVSNCHFEITYPDIHTNVSGSGGLQVFGGTSSYVTLSKNQYHNVTNNYTDCEGCSSDGEYFHNSSVQVKEWGEIKNFQVLVDNSAYVPSYSTAPIRTSGPANSPVRYVNGTIKIVGSYSNAFGFQPGFNGSKNAYVEDITIEGNYTQGLVLGNNASSGIFRNAVLKEISFIPYQDGASNFAVEDADNVKIIRPTFYDSTFVNIDHFDFSVGDPTKIDGVYLLEPTILGGTGILKNTANAGKKAIVARKFMMFETTNDFQSFPDLQAGDLVAVNQGSVLTARDEGIRFFQMVDTAGLTADDNRVYTTTKPNLFAMASPIRIDTLLTGLNDQVLITNHAGSGQQAGVAIDFANNMASGDYIFLGKNPQGLPSHNNLSISTNEGGNAKIRVLDNGGSIMLATGNLDQGQILIHGRDDGANSGKLHILAADMNDDIEPQNLVIKAADALSTASTNQDGAGVVIDGGASAGGGGTDGDVSIATNRGRLLTDSLEVGGYPINPRHVIGSATSVTTDVDGEVQIAHGASFTPNWASVVVLGDNSYNAKVVSVDGTNLTILLKDEAGADVGSTAVSFYWEVAEIP